MSQFFSQILVVGMIGVAIAIALVVMGVVRRPLPWKNNETGKENAEDTTYRYSSRSSMHPFEKSNQNTQPLMFWTVAHYGPTGIKEIPLHLSKEGEFVIGRSKDADMCIDSPRVSRRHAVIARDDQGYFLQDAGSTTHTYIEGTTEPIDEINLSHGLRLYLGDAKIMFKYSDPFTTRNDTREDDGGVHRRHNHRGDTKPYPTKNRRI